MKINTQTTYSNTVKNKPVSSKGAREVLKTLANPDSLASTIFLESFVTGGRSINAYKRSGFYEARERFTDDVVSAFFWMKGVDIFNKIGNNFGKHILKLPVVDFDCGKDALRNPMNNLVHDLSENSLNPKLNKSIYNKLSIFKFTKIIASSLLAIGFVGFCLPKINQAITKKLMNHKKTDNNSEDNTINKFINMSSFEEFDKKITKNNSNTLGFKGIPTGLITTLAHNLENNKICKMLTCDTGILTGRVKTARNKDEALEYFFRDTASSFFYYASTPLIFKLLQTVNGSKNSTTIDPVASKQIHNTLIEQLKKSGLKSVNAEDFIKNSIGVLDDKSKEILDKLPFKSDVITFDELKKYVTDENLIKKAEQMSKLQPELKGLGKVLTKQQVCDVFKNGTLNTPDFMEKIFKEKFKGDLTNPYKFIPMKKITNFRENIDKYVLSIADEAIKNNGSVVDETLLNKVNKKSFALSACFRMIAIGISAIMLGVVIPKIQYAITTKRTGKNEAPGLREYNSSSQIKKS